jgi:hypothetical protein
MPVKQVTAVTVPVDGRSGIVLDRFPARTPLLAILTTRPALLVTLTLPDRVEPGHVRFARSFAASAAEDATEVERKWRGLPPMPAAALTR